MDTPDTLRASVTDLCARLEAYAWHPDLAATNFAPSFAAGRRMGEMMHTINALRALLREMLPMPAPDAPPLTDDQEAQEAYDRA